LIREILDLLGQRYTPEEFASALTRVADRMREAILIFKQEGQGLSQRSVSAFPPSSRPDQLLDSLRYLKEAGEVLERLPGIVEHQLAALDAMASLSRLMAEQAKKKI
jgi:hypothetical protein